ncbi:acyl-CoA thioesterase [Puniceibacterium sediminis]|uniref:Thioesterase-like superfamily protein n=1 Tax=Puniceibacterium sediminis TaxID=1608407 RepID=A0A238VTR0_9RHOB|nr:acyl-CoA thioesterase [Puniceibacterium sediminis]SNR37705.1 Thioesterase-like superfamily protein [Puniceibacterium sediminis]
MYPFVRLFKELFLHRNAPRLALGEVHVSHHICWPWDIDLWMELNNGRTLTVYDLGRIPMAQRSGLITVLRRMRWGLTIAGTSVRYRRRVRMFDRIEMRSRLLCWDARFMYLEQSMWKTDGECSSHAVYRSAITDRNGIVPTSDVMLQMGIDVESPAMPDWVVRWTEAEALRPWPPMQDDVRIGDQ